MRNQMHNTVANIRKAYTPYVEHAKRTVGDTCLSHCVVTLQQSPDSNELKYGHTTVNW
jgi:hypothetical protein